MGVQVPSSAPLFNLFWLLMAHILILRTKQNDELTGVMSRAVVDVLNANGHTYDEILVPSIKDLPISLNMLAESLNYEASICVSSVVKNEHEDTKLHYQEVIRCIYDYSTYFGHLVGQCITYHENTKADLDGLFKYAQAVGTSVCELIKTIRDINSMESSRYGGNIKHN
jgi:6,7-dimethyl-8-ribityllumazine synthase